MEKKKRYTSEEKAIILREHLDNKMTISELADKYGVHPNAIYHWKKLLYEGAPTNLKKQALKADKEKLELERRIAELEKTLSVRESLIADLVADNINLKKKTAGEVSIRNGLNQR